MPSAAEILGLQVPQAGPVVQPGGPATQAVSEQDPTLQSMSTPAKSQEEVAQRVQGWQAVLAKVQQDPNLMRAIGLTGAYLMQPTPAGQTDMGHFGRAFMYGNAAYGFGQQAQQDLTKSQQEEARKQAESQAVVNQRTAETARIQTLTPLEADKARKDLDLADAKIDEARTADERNRALAAKTQLENDLMQKFGKEKYEAEIASVRAQTVASTALTEERKVSTAGKLAENELKTLEAKVANGTATAEEKARHAELVNLKRKSGTPLSSTVQSMEYIKELRKTAHPEETEAQRAQWLLDYQQTSKTDPLKQAMMLEELASLETDLDRRGELLKQAEELRARALVSRGGPAPGKPASGASGAVQKWSMGPDGKPIMVGP